MAKEAKDDVDYSVGHLRSHCGPTFRADNHYCKHFIPGTGDKGTCEVVEGQINPVYWCNRFKRTGT